MAKKKEVVPVAINGPENLRRYIELCAQIKALDEKAAPLRDERDGLKAGIVLAAGALNETETAAGFKWAGDLFGFSVSVSVFERASYEVPACVIERATVKGL